MLLINNQEVEEQTDIKVRLKARWRWILGTSRTTTPFAGPGRGCGYRASGRMTINVGHHGASHTIGSFAIRMKSDLVHWARRHRGGVLHGAWPLRRAHQPFLTVAGGGLH